MAFDDVCQCFFEYDDVHGSLPLDSQSSVVRIIARDNPISPTLSVSGFVGIVATVLSKRMWLQLETSLGVMVWH